MFQFPGFALKTLCIQVLSTCFSSLKTTKAVYNELSGGFPHSEIPGSKLILNSPGLIAEYHVLHRLLLPRHPPNALLALDLIQKKTDLLSLTSHPRRGNWTKSILSRPILRLDIGHILTNATWLVYLTWTTLPFQRAYSEGPEERTDKACPEGHPKRSPPTCGNQQRCYFSL